MNKFIIGLAVTGALGLTGCGGDGPAEPSIPSGTNGEAGQNYAETHPVYSPSEGDIPLPNDLLFSGTEDLTLNVPPTDAHNPTDPSDPFAQLSRLDGWSPVAPFLIEFTDAINTETVAGNIRVFKVQTLRSEIPVSADLSTIAPTGPVIGIEKELAANEINVSAVAANAVRLTPLQPLEPQAAYMVVVTNGITDDDGNPITSDVQYGLAQQSEELNGDLAALEPVRQLVNQMETVAAAAGIDKSSIVMSYQFTTQSVYDVMATTKLVADGTIQQIMESVPAEIGSRAIINMLPRMNGATPATTNDINPALPGLAWVYEGSLNVPYYLTASEPDVNPSDGSQLPVSHDTAALFSSWQGQEFPPGSGERNLTYFNKRPLPSKPDVNNGMETVPVLLTVPRANQFGEPLTKPEGGWPVVIYQHGVTRNRADMLAFADKYAAMGYAVIAIDQPLHGLSESHPLFKGYLTNDDNGRLRERTFGVDYFSEDPATGAVVNTAPDGVPDSSGLHYFNIQSLSTFRDNFRQSAADLLFFSRALTLATIDADMNPDFNSDRIYFVGDSLGGLAGANFLGYDDIVDAAVLNYAGGGFAGFLQASDVLSAQFNPALAAQGIVEGTAEYAAFLFAAQTIADAGDTINHAAMVRNSEIPLVMYQVPEDVMVPNNGIQYGFPLTGTEPLAATIALQQPSAEQVEAGWIGNPADPDSVVKTFIKFTDGNHGDFFNPAAFGTAVQEQMQNGALSLFETMGRAYQIENADVIQVD